MAATRTRVGARHALRLLLLAGVVFGLFGMHVLTAGDGGTGGHGALPIASTASHAMTGGDAATPDHAGQSVVKPPMMVIATASEAGADGMAGGHGGIAACVLFLVVGGAIIALMLSRCRIDAALQWRGRSALRAATDIVQRGPPRRPPRLSLCVIRI